jgi:hypothetical protein
MATTASDIGTLTEAYVKRLGQGLDVERVIFVGECYGGIGGELSDLRFVVVSSTFRGMDHLGRARTLGRVGLAVSPVLEGWPFAPEEFTAHLSAEKYNLLLAQYLPGSREVYLKPGATPLQKLLKAARRKS